MAQQAARDLRLERTQVLRAPPSPFLKWAGGKSRLLPQLVPLLPNGVELMRHVEPFVGGGAMFFSRAPGRALLCDVNPALIATYESVRDDIESVTDHLEVLAARHDAAAYYRARERYNAMVHTPCAEHAALFIYLNKTCFNGLHRVNRRGEFNVPAGRYKSPRIVDPVGLRAASQALRRAELRCTSFEDTLSAARPGDFVYFDPPYEPISKTASFTSYAQGGFSRAHQARLRDVFAALHRRGCKLMLSNSDAPYVRELYAGWRIDEVAAPRAISCKADGRGFIKELVIRNYG